METQDIWSVLSKVNIGTIVAWATVIATIITTICTITVKVYKIFTKYNNLKDEYGKQKEAINSHEIVLNRIKESLEDIQKSLSEQREVNLKQIRYSIVHTCDEAISNSEISASKLKSLEEMFEEYVEVFHANGYVKVLMDKVRKLPIVGSLND